MCRSIPIHSRCYLSAFCGDVPPAASILPSAKRGAAVKYRGEFEDFTIIPDLFRAQIRGRFWQDSLIVRRQSSCMAVSL